MVPRLGSGIALVGRGQEMDRLQAALDGASAGSPAALLVSGDAGVGKTRVVEELSARAAAGGARVLIGRCIDAGDAGLPYLPFADALGALPEGDRVELVTPALARLFPDSALPSVADAEPAARLPGPSTVGVAAGRHTGGRVEPHVGQLQLFDAVYGVLAELAGRHPAVVLVVEDLHWADASTRALLSFLVSRLRAQRILIVATYRGEDLHRRHPLRPMLAEMVRLPVVQRVQLDPFDPADARSFVAALAEEPLPADTVADVAQRSEGNAFFAEELLASYVDGCRGLPANLADVLLSRVDRLTENAQQVLRVASVAGPRVSHERLRAVAALTDPELDEALRESVQHNVLVVVGGGEVYAFRHALLREAVYDDLLPGERVRLHAGYARELSGEQGRGVSAELAHHALESHALSQALAASVDAAREAEQLGAPAESLEHLQRALTLWSAVPDPDRPSGTDELALLRKASWVAGTAGEQERASAYARSAVRAADESGDPELAAQMRRRLAETLYVMDGKEDEALAVIERAWAVIEPQPPSVVKAWVLAVYAVIERGFGHAPQARRWAELAVRTAREAGARAAEADALITLAVLDENAGHLEDNTARLDEAMRIAAADGAISVELRARHYLGISRYEWGRLDDAVRVIDAGVDRAAQTGMSWSTYGLELRYMQVLGHYATGDWDAAAVAAQPPAHRVPTTAASRLAVAGSLVSLGRGEYAEIERLLAEHRSDWDRDIVIGLTLGSVGTELALWQGRPDQAVAHARQALDWVLEVLGGAWLMSGIRFAALGLAGCADLTARRGRPEVDVEAHAERFVAHARLTAERGRPRTGTLGPEGRAWLARAIAEHSRLHGTGDPRLWRAAVDEFGYGAIYEQASCRLRLAEALLGADHRDEAERELLAADEVAATLGATPLREAVGRLARRARISLGGVAPARSTMDVFTPRERSVLQLVAQGGTNREVGEALFISEKTVSVHLSRIMAKLGATRRTEAVAIAIERGLLD